MATTNPGRKSSSSSISSSSFVHPSVAYDFPTLAASFLEDSFHARKVGYLETSAALYPLSNPPSIHRYLLFHSALLRNIFLVAAVTHLLLILFEKPSIFFHDSDAQQQTSNRVALAVEIVVLFIYFIDLYGRFRIVVRWPPACLSGWRREKDIPVTRAVLKIVYRLFPSKYFCCTYSRRRVLQCDDRDGKGAESDAEVAGERKEENDHDKHEQKVTLPSDSQPQCIEADTAPTSLAYDFLFQYLRNPVASASEEELDRQEEASWYSSLSSSPTSSPRSSSLQSPLCVTVRLGLGLGEGRLRDWWIIFRLILFLIFLTDLFAFSLFPSFVRFSKCLRPFMLLSRLRSVREVFLALIFSLRAVLSTLILIFLNIVFFGLLSFLAFSSFPSTSSISYFSSPGAAMYSFLLAQTAFSYQLQMLEAYAEQSRFSTVLISAYVILTNFLFIKLLLSFSSNSFKERSRHNLKIRHQKRIDAIFAAFLLLQDSSSRRVPLSSFFAIFRILRPTLPLYVPCFLFGAFDSYGRGELDWPEWLRLCQALETKVELKEKDNAEDNSRRHCLGRMKMTMKRMITFHPTITTNQSWLGVMQIRFHPFAVAVNILVVFQVVQLLAVSHAINASNSMSISSYEASLSSAWSVAGMVVQLALISEQLAKLFVFGSSTYFTSALNRFDFICTSVSFLAFLFNVLLFHSVSLNYTNAFSIISLTFKLLRVFRLLFLAPSLALLLYTVDRIFLLIMHLLFVFFSFLYFFSVIAMHLYSSTLTTSNPVLQRTDWAPYSASLNFIDFFASLQCTFQMSFVSKWVVVLEACELLSPGVYSARFFFISFRLLIASVILPMVTGFIVEAFTKNYAGVEMEMRKKGTKEQEEDGENENASEKKEQKDKEQHDRKTDELTKNEMSLNTVFGHSVMCTSNLQHDQSSASMPLLAAQFPSPRSSGSSTSWQQNRCPAIPVRPNSPLSSPSPATSSSISVFSAMKAPQVTSFSSARIRCMALFQHTIHARISQEMVKADSVSARHTESMYFKLLLQANYSRRLSIQTQSCKYGDGKQSKAIVEVDFNQPSLHHRGLSSDLDLHHAAVTKSISAGRCVNLRFHLHRRKSEVTASALGLIDAKELEDDDLDVEDAIQ